MHVDDRCPSCGSKPERLGGDLVATNGPDHMQHIDCESCGWHEFFDSDEVADLRPDNSGNSVR